MSGSYPNGSSNNQVNYDRLVEKAASLRQTLADYQTGKSVRRQSYTATLEAKYRGQINTILARLEIARKYILQTKEKVVAEESTLKEKQRALWEKNKEICDINTERFQNNQVGLKNQIFLKQLLLQGSQRYTVQRKLFMAKKMELFEEFLGRKSKANALGEKLQMLKDGRLRVIVQEKALREEKDKLFKEDQERRKYKNHLVDEIEKCKKRKADNCIKLQHQKEMIFELQKENFERQEQINSLRLSRSPRQRSIIRRIVSFFCLRSNVD
eukprot:gene15442-17020_t